MGNGGEGLNWATMMFSGAHRWNLASLVRRRSAVGFGYKRTRWSVAARIAFCTRGNRTALCGNANKAASPKSTDSQFAWRGALDYRLGIPMLVAGISGGFFGARIVKRLKESTARNAILIYAWALTIWFFIKQLQY